jgi:hypothetical protein
MIKTVIMTRRPGESAGFLWHHRARTGDDGERNMRRLADIKASLSRRVLCVMARPHAL